MCVCVCEYMCVCVSICVKIDGEDKSRKKDCTVELNKSNDIRARGRRKGTGRDGPLTPSSPRPTA